MGTVLTTGIFKTTLPNVHGPNDQGHDDREVIPGH